MYTNRIFGEQNLRQNVRKFCQKFNHNKITYIIKYSLKVQFSISYYTRQLHGNNLLNMKRKKKVTTTIQIHDAWWCHEVLPNKYANCWPKVNQWQNTVCLEQHIYAIPDNFTPTLMVMLETFRRSGFMLIKQYKLKKKKTFVTPIIPTFPLFTAPKALHPSSPHISTLDPKR